MAWTRGWGYAAKEAAGNQVKPLKVLAVLFVLFLTVEYTYKSIQEHRLLQAQLEEIKEKKRRADVPVEAFMDVRQVHILSGWKNDDPQMYIDRSINWPEPFAGDWDVVVKTADNEFLCSAFGYSSGYSKQSKLPPIHKLRLVSWWMNLKDPATQCTVWPFPPGEKCATTRWTLYPDGYPPKFTGPKVACWTDYEPEQFPGLK